MSNRRLEVFHYRQVLYQMQQGMSDRAIALGGTMGRRKAAQLRCKAATEGWLTPGASLPDDATLAALFITPKQGNTGPVSTLEAKLIKAVIVRKSNYSELRAKTPLIKSS